MKMLNKMHYLFTSAIRCKVLKKLQTIFDNLSSKLRCNYPDIFQFICSGYIKVQITFNQYKQNKNTGKKTRTKRYMKKSSSNNQQSNPNQ